MNDANVPGRGERNLDPIGYLRRLLQGTRSAAPRPPEVSRTDLTLLMLLCRRGEASVAELARFGRSATLDLSVRVARLESSGLVRRTSPQGRADRIILEPTPAGELVVARAAFERQARFAARLAGLPRGSETTLDRAAPILAVLAAIDQLG